MEPEEELLFKKISDKITSDDGVIYQNDLDQIRQSEAVMQRIESMPRGWRGIYDHCEQSLRQEVVKIAAERAKRPEDCLSFSGVAPYYRRIMLLRAMALPCEFIHYVWIARAQPEEKEAKEAWEEALKLISCTKDSIEVIETTTLEWVVADAVGRGAPLARSSYEADCLVEAIAKKSFGTDSYNKKIRNDLFLLISKVATESSLQLKYEEPLSRHMLK